MKSKSACAWVWAAIVCAAGLATPLPARAVTEAIAVPDSTNKWGYGYDSLLRDLEGWRKSPFVKVDSIGATVQGRALWMVSITDSTDSLGAVDDSSSRKHRIIIHARTHPAEVQAFYVARETIKFLLDTGLVAERLRGEFIINIIPMYNPDGVELGHPRRNADTIDLESNWNQKVLEPEVVALKRAFEGFQAGQIPVDVALNLHSDQYNCTRFFFFHYKEGTSAYYENLERYFIGGVQAYFPGGIEDWSFVASWGDGFKSQYPESFWWTKERENVMALTYEDANCANAARFDSTARSLVLGARDFIYTRAQVDAARERTRSVARVLLSPEGIRILGSLAGSRWQVVDVQGRRLAAGGFGPEGATIAWSSLPAAPVRVLFVARPFQAVERLLLPIHR